MKGVFGVGALGAFVANSPVMGGLVILLGFVALPTLLLGNIVPGFVAFVMWMLPILAPLVLLVLLVLYVGNAMFIEGEEGSVELFMGLFGSAVALFVFWIVYSFMMIGYDSRGSFGTDDELAYQRGVAECIDAIGWLPRGDKFCTKEPRNAHDPPFFHFNS